MIDVIDENILNDKRLNYVVFGVNVIIAKKKKK